MTTQQKLKAWFQEWADTAGLRFVVRRQKDAFYMIIQGDVLKTMALMKRALPESYTTSGAMDELTYRLYPPEAIDRLVAGMEVDPTWLTWNDATVRRLAEAMRAERAFDRLPILADALLEAGCTNEMILTHCKEAGTHVGSCWVIDVLLGPERKGKAR